MQLPVYLDHNATTPLEPRVLDAMMPFMKERYGNPSSGHSFGQAARDALTTAREQVARLVNAHPTQVIFTSGGTEANNLAIKGIARKTKGPIAVSAIEHASVTQPAAFFRADERIVQTIGVDEQGRVTPDTLNQALKQMPASPDLVSIMLANNESGVVQDIAAIVDHVRHNCEGAVIHTDAVQAAGKIDVDFPALGVHMLSLSAHKLYGPKGAGALIVDKSVDREPLLHGGLQESGNRAGTENVAGIVGFGKAAEIAAQELEQRNIQLLQMRRRLENAIKQTLPKAVVFAEGVERLPNTIFMAVPGIDGETLLINLDQAGLAISSGSACESASLEPSHVLMAMGVETTVARCAIRISLGKDNTNEEIDYFIRQLKQHVDMLQGMASIVSAL